MQQANRNEIDYLLVLVSPDLEPHDLEVIGSMIYGGEEELALEQLLWMAVNERRAFTSTARALLQELSRIMPLGDEYRKLSERLSAGKLCSTATLAEPSELAYAFARMLVLLIPCLPPEESRAIGIRIHAGDWIGALNLLGGYAAEGRPKLSPWAIDHALRLAERLGMGGSTPAHQLRAARAAAERAVRR